MTTSKMDLTAEDQAAAKAAETAKMQEFINKYLPTEAQLEAYILGQKEKLIALQKDLKTKQDALAKAMAEDKANSERENLPTVKYSEATKAQETIVNGLLTEQKRLIQIVGDIDKKAEFDKELAAAKKAKDAAKIAEIEEELKALQPSKYAAKKAYFYDNLTATVNKELSGVKGLTEEMATLLKGQLAAKAKNAISEVLATEEAEMKKAELDAVIAKVEEAVKGLGLPSGYRVTVHQLGKERTTKPAVNNQEDNSGRAAPNRKRLSVKGTAPDGTAFDKIFNSASAYLAEFMPIFGETVPTTAYNARKRMESFNEKHKIEVIEID